MPRALAADDFNNDGRLDIVVGNQNEKFITLLFGYDRGALGNSIVFVSGEASRLQAVVVSDFNHDTWLDLAVANYGTNDIGILFGRSNGTFERQILYRLTLGSAPYSIALQDFNH
ncbi:unnamed protein product, partial [Adineta ricciae]